MIEYVIKRDGRKEAFDPEKLNSWGIWASKTIDPKVVNWSSVVLRTVSTLPKQVTTDELQKALIKSCIDMDTYEHNRMAGRLYADALPKQLYKDRKYPHIRDLHKEMSKKGLIRKDINYTDEEYDRINKMIKHKRDIGYTYYSSHHIMSKYAKKDHTTKKTYETPQFVYMRVAMQTFLNYQGEDRMEKLENLYTKLSTRKINIPTPYFANSLTSNPNVASCSVLTTKDEAQSIGIGSLLAYSLTTSGAGLGLHLKTRSLGDAVRGGDIEHSGKVPYYRAYAHSIKSSKQGSRGGAGTMYFPFFDPEVITLLNLKNPLSVDSKRLRELDYALLVNKWFVRKAIKKEPVWLFSYKDNPELYELFYDKDPDAFGVAMEEFAQKHKKKVTEVNASEILAACLRQSVETGRVYMMFADEANRRSPYKEKIYSSNLCIAGDQLVVSDKGLLTAEELYTLEGDSLVLFDGKKPVQSSSMKLRGISEDVYKITLKNGMTHTVTDYHKVMTNKGLVQCKHLVPGEHKAKINVSEGIFGTNDMVDEAYLLGLWQGDGTTSGQEIHIDVWEDKTAHLRDIILETYLRVRDKYTGGIYEVKNQTGVVVGTRKYSQPVFTLSSKVGSKDKWRLSSRVLKKYLDFKKNEIPLWVRQGTKQTQIAYIKGLFQTDGTYTYSSNAHYLSISQTNREFLESLQILLNNLGYIFSLSVGRKAGNYLLPDSNRELKEYSCKEIYRLVSGNFYTCLKFEKDTGFMSFRGKTLPEPIKQVYAPKEFIDIVSVEYVGKEDVYCPTVNSDEHLFVGNCFITRNCTEILLPTKPYGSIEDLSSSDVDKGTVAFCNLAGIVVDNIEDDTDYEDSCYYALLMIDEGINNALLPYESLNHSIRYYRSAGVGILGLAHLMAKNKLSYKSREGLTFIHNLAEKHAYYLYKSALRLGKERGNAECMDRTLFPEGWLPIDVMNPNLGDLCDTELKYDWETLRQEIVANGGIRFSTVSTIPPSENCLAFDTKVKTDKGDMTLKEIFDGYVDTSLDEAMRDYSPLTGGKWYELNQPLKALTASGEYHTIPRIWLNGIVKPFKITLEDGTVVKATESHKFLTDRGWVPAYDLKVGDNIINIAEE